MTDEVCKMLKIPNSAFNYGDEEAMRTSRNNLNRAIKLAKRAHRQKIQNFFHDATNTRNMWKGIQANYNYKLPPLPAGETDMDFLNNLHNFNGMFLGTKWHSCGEGCPHQDERADVRKMLRRVDTWKAPTIYLGGF